MSFLKRARAAGTAAVVAGLFTALASQAVLGQKPGSAAFT